MRESEEQARLIAIRLIEEGRRIAERPDRFGDAVDLGVAMIAAFGVARQIEGLKNVHERLYGKECST